MLKLSRCGRECFNPRPCERGDAFKLFDAAETLRFQSTPLREGRRAYLGADQAQSSVSIHAPARGATRGKSDRCLARSGFNPRPCERGDLFACSVFFKPLWFQSTPLREGRPPSKSVKKSHPLFQSTPLREGRPLLDAILHDRHDVSIHAPARGATLYGPDNMPIDRVSIHAPARGATCHPAHHTPVTRGFNPRPCERGDFSDK